MKKTLSLTTLCLLCLPFIGLSQEQTTKSTIEYGLVLNPNFETTSSQFKEGNGIRIEAGAYLYRTLNERWSISLDARISYLQSSRTYNNIINMDQFFPRDTLIDTRRGTIAFENIALNLPIKLRYQPFKTFPGYFMIGYAPQLNFSFNPVWEFDEYDRNWLTNEFTLIATDQTEELDGTFIDHNALIGLGYKKGKWMLDAHLMSAGLNIEDSSFINSISSIAIGLNLYYRLQ
jgi:hypothetical protein